LPEPENKITDLLPDGDIQAFPDGLTDHLVTKLVPVALLATANGSPIFTISLESVNVDLLWIFSFFLQALVKTERKHIERKTLIIVFIINVFVLLNNIRLNIAWTLGN
jgi:hypothetical protein